MLARSQPVDSDYFGETIARFPAAGASSSQSGGAQSSFSLHRSALMAARAASRALIPAQPRARARIKAALLARDAARVSACGSHSRVLELVTASHWYARTAFVLVDGSPVHACCRRGRLSRSRLAGCYTYSQPPHDSRESHCIYLESLVGCQSATSLARRHDSHCLPRECICNAGAQRSQRS